MGRQKKKSVDDTINNFFINGRGLKEYEVCQGFVDIFTKEVDKVVHDCDIIVLDEQNENVRTNLTSFYIPKASSGKVIKIINEMKKKSPGIDNIRIQDIIECESVASPLITKMINTSIKSGRFPDKLKTAIVRPIYKGDDHKEFKNYRPISILSVLDKIIERYVGDYLTKYLTENKIITLSQYAYQRGKGTNELLSDFSDFANNTLNEKKHILMTFVDFSKAFDSLKHCKILKVLEKNGINGNLKDWFRSYLENRKLVVKINDTYSRRAILNSGVPQGSILGPILYLLYVNEIPNLMKYAKVYMYADDTALVVAHENVLEAERQLQHDFTRLTVWCHDYGLVMNGKKSKVMHIHSPRVSSVQANIKLHTYSCLHDCLYIDNVCSCDVLEQVVNFCYLGVTIDKHLKWDFHINKICQRLRLCLGKFYYLKQYLPYNTLHLIYASLCESIIRYGIRSWGSAVDTRLLQVEDLQRRILKIILPDHMRHCIREEITVFHITQTLPVKKLFFFINYVDFYFSLEYKTINIHKYFSRKRLYVVPRINNGYGKRTRQRLIPTLFNRLPEDLQNCNTYKQVKVKIGQFLMLKNIHV
ncbi:hypothetical protein J6590_106427 [Homalodisca vitripennis]|nr:hypothetical protein J6590_106427 [Homalodisca vitripennis]